MSWTDERIATLKKMWKEGKSAADIAKTLGKGVTRNAVIGKAHRMGLSGRPSPIKKPVASAPKKEKEVARKKVAIKVVIPPAPKKKAVTATIAPLKPAAEVRTPISARGAKEPVLPRPLVQEAPPADGGVALIDLSERMCKWPYGDPQDDDFTFCGRGIRPGTPYCPEHAAQAYQTSTRSRTAVAYEEKPVEADDEDEVEDAAEAEVDEE